jgi:hypothetical protein
MGMSARQYNRLKTIHNRNVTPSRTAITLKLEGVDQLAWRLEMLPEKLRKSVMRRAMDNGAKILLASMKQEVPSETVTLHRSLNYVIRSKTAGGSKGKRGRSVGYPYVVFGPMANFNREVLRSSGKWAGQVSRQNAMPNNYEHLVDGGAKPHQQFVRNGKRLKKDIMHPGSKPSNYRRRAVQAVDSKVMQAVFSTIDRAIFKNLSSLDKPN